MPQLLILAFFNVLLVAVTASSYAQAWEPTPTAKAAPTISVSIEKHGQVSIYAPEATLGQILEAIASSAQLRLTIGDDLPMYAAPYDQSYPSLEVAHAKLLANHDYILEFETDPSLGTQRLFGVRILGNNSDAAIFQTTTSSEAAETDSSQFPAALGYVPADTTDRFANGLSREIVGSSLRSEPDDAEWAPIDGVPTEDLLAVALDRLGSRSPQRRLESVRALRLTATGEAIMLLGQVALGDPAPEVRAEAVTQLRSIGDAMSMAFVAAALKGEQ